MKKVMFLLVALFIGLVSVNAMTESELEAKLTKSYTVNGSTFKASDSQKVLIKRYLDQYEVSSSDADYISGKLDEAKNILQASGKGSFYDLSRADKDKIIALCADVSSNTSVKVTINKGKLVVYVPGTNDVFYQTPVNPVNGDIVQTNDNLTVAVAGIISVLGIAIAVRKLRANA
jgi:hypothetical protein